ncbi:MAG TPA: DegV family protein [Anaerolineae bacterium]|nr:DegV family protein [Anaerolineae bacterium]HOQ99879.1 DegV family protein [Anaerolineae bacterium]HPL30527.1 DegV family protein [Anaerolineae bacterium]
MIKVVVDSASSITRGMAEPLGIHVIPIKISFGDRTFSDGVDIGPAEFYERLRASQVLPVTSQPSAGEFLDLFKELTADGSEVLCILLSSGLSGAVLSAQTARDMLPERSIHIFDTQAISVGQTLLAVAAGEMVAGGTQSAAVVVARLEALRARMRTWLVLDTLEYVRRGGRVSGVEALVGTMLRIKPIVHMAQGKLAVGEKVRTKARAVERMLELAEAEFGRQTPVWCGVGGADCLTEVLALEEAVRTRFNCARLWHAETGPTIATHGGPGVIGLAICPME